MDGRRHIPVLSLLAIALGFAAIFALQRRIDRGLGAVHEEQDDLLLRSGRLVRVLSLGYDSLLADVYWTRTVQYYGEKHARHDPDLQLLAPLLDMTTSLDPHLVVAYKYGAIFLAEPKPRGAGRPDLAVNLLQRAIENNPDQWRLWSDLGFIYYWELKDYQKASDAFLEGSKNPQARDWMKVLAAKIAEEGRSTSVSMFLWKQIYDSTQDANIRKNALEHLHSLRAEEDAKHIEEFAGEFEKRFGHPPASMADLVRAGLLPEQPVDPAGWAYELRNRKVYLNPASPVASDELKVPVTH